MRSDYQAIQQSMRKAYWTLAKGKGVAQVKPENITMPAYIIQEQAFVNTIQTYTFNFGTNAPQPTSALGNIILGENNVAVGFALQVLVGEGATANNRIYRTRGLTTNDNSLYNANISAKFESQEPIENIRMNQFFEEDNYNGLFAGMVPVEPLRIFTGRVAKSQVIISFPNSISALTLTSNLYISIRWVIALGLA